MTLPAWPCLSLVGALLLAAPSAFAAARLNAGSWEFTMTTDGETQKVVSCITAEQATALNADSKTGRAAAEKNAGGRCSVKAYEAEGDRISYTLVCGDRTISDVTHFHGETSEGVKTVTVDGKTTTTQVKSKRLGVCPAKP